MKENQNTCPVCFTKMKSHKDGLICPECGYKLCDHRHNADIYNTPHTHTPNYTSAYPAARTNPAPGFSVRDADQTPQNKTDANLIGNKVGKLIRTVVIFYILYLLLSVFGATIIEFLNGLLF